MSAQHAGRARIGSAAMPALPGLAGFAGPVALLAVLLVALGGSAPALAPTAQVEGVPSDARAMDLLERAAQAPASVAYHGVQFVSAWSEAGSSSLVVEIDHRPGHGTTVRSGSTVESPAADTFLPADGSEPSVLGSSGPLDLLAANFTVVLAGRASVSGRAADIVEAQRAGSGLAAARFWLDTETALVLRREVYDERGRTTRASAFVEIALGSTQPAAATHLPPAMPPAWSDEVDYSDRAAMSTGGWECPDELPGSLDLVDARRGGEGDNQILHLSYSDGLATVSLFEQRGVLDEENLDGYSPVERDGRRVFVRDGVPQRVVWSAGGTVFTVVADAPPATVDAVVAALPHDPVEDGGWHRLGRGLDRVSSWFNPFG